MAGGVKQVWASFKQRINQTGSSVAGTISRTLSSVKWRLAPPRRGWTADPDRVHLSELAVVSKRRASVATGQPEIAADTWPPPNLDTVGLCLSGGGIRSAAFSLGALQALDAKRIAAGAAGGSTSVFSFVDYLSTVSGGGYIGSALSDRMKGQGPFPFRSLLGGEEPAALKGIRDRSNYLFPPREWALVTNVAIYLRGLFLNVLSVAALLLVLAGITLFVRPHLMRPGLLGLLGTWFLNQMLATVGVAWTMTSSFPAALALVSAFLVFLLAWATFRSAPEFDAESEVHGRMTRVGRALLVLAVAAFALELQPFLIDFMVNTGAWQGKLTSFSATLAVASGVIGYFRAYLQKLAEMLVGSPGWKARLTRILFFILALPVPLLVWLAYLVICAQGYEWVGGTAPSIDARPDIAGWYLGIGVVALILISQLSPNANSLHRLYRERLNWAFFRTNQGVDVPIGAAKAPVDGIAVPKLSALVSRSGPYHVINTSINLQGSRYLNERGRNADVFIFSPKYVGSRATGYVSTAIFEAACPDLDLGTAMAISGAAVSPNMGASTLRWLTPTLAFLNVRLGYWIRNPLTFRTTGGAAAGWTKRAIRWMKNVRQAGIGRSIAFFVVKWLARRSGAYFIWEALGRLDERRPEVYLTDGGHIDDLGLTEMLRRRCRLIIVIDGEQDGALRFPSFVSLQRYARIDHGIRIDVPWQQIHDRSLAVSAGLADDGKVDARPGPHAALGVIRYNDNPDDNGLLLYVKSSLSGDEPDYVMDYALRNGAFPHESTVDQFFTEEQFEVYRALGFHALFGVLDGTDCLAVRPDPSPPDCKDAEPPAPLKRIGDDMPLLEKFRAVFGGFLPPAAPAPPPPVELT